jgi:hypothetical protein
MRRARTTIAALIALAAAVAPLGAFAQSAPVQTPPSYARPSYGSDEEVVRGRIAAFDGAYDLQLRDDRGFIDNVRLQQGTIINPTGIRLAAGMSATIYGVNSGTYLTANEIDTPYDAYGAVPPYPVYPYAYPYAFYPYPYPNFSIGIGFGPYRRWR